MIDQASLEAGSSMDPIMVTAAIVVFAVMGVAAAWLMWWPELRRHIGWWREQRQWEVLDRDSRWRQQWQENDL